ncbi:biotin transport system substrate-specific component [Propionicimonas paludicola]|uniref:Biotin transporter n=1 Tax=Propionicimonas paludicola TaxID=185243 RepID=A0A2A9CQV8_9ACTN|nr:biotin transporter BioY [Propionicimonas paludicola]PFG16506.1 biotin transport system substrate-specific component [Propionicimonas paludicola]
MTDQANTEATTAVAAAEPRAKALSATDLALIAAFAALIAALAYIGAIPVAGAGVPITLQTLGVALAGAVLGPLRGSLSVLLYLALGAIGLPVFAEHSAGLGVFTSVSFGYLISFPIAAALIGYLVKYVVGAKRSSALWVFLAIAAGSILVIHPLGVAGMKLHQDVSWATAFSWDLPFWLGDLVKTTIAAIVAAEVHRAFPALLKRR